MDVLSLMATITLTWTNPQYQANRDSTYVNDDPRQCEGNPALPVHLTHVDIYRAQVGGNGTPLFLRSHLYGAVPLTDSIQVPDTPAASYFIEPWNVVGPGCRKGKTVGVPNVGVPMPLEPKKMLLRPGYFDIMGRRIEPTRSGRYFGRDTLIVK